jgi:succinylarginine dihydrolase
MPKPTPDACLRCRKPVAAGAVRLSSGWMCQACYTRHVAWVDQWWADLIARGLIRVEPQR